MKFIVEPYVGVNYLNFGMTQEEVIRRMGKPSAETKNYFGDTSFLYFDINIGFSKTNNLLSHFGFGENINIKVDDVNIFTDNEALKKIMLLDGEPYKYKGDIYLFRYGVCLSEFLNNNEDYEKSLVVFMKGKNLDVKEKGELIKL